MRQYRFYTYRLTFRKLYGAVGGNMLLYPMEAVLKMVRALEDYPVLLPDRGDMIFDPDPERMDPKTRSVLERQVPEITAAGYVFVGYTYFFLEKPAVGNTILAIAVFTTADGETSVSTAYCRTGWHVMSAHEFNSHFSDGGIIATTSQSAILPLPPFIEPELLRRRPFAEVEARHRERLAAAKTQGRQPIRLGPENRAEFLIRTEWGRYDYYKSRGLASDHEPGTRVFTHCRRAAPSGQPSPAPLSTATTTDTASDKSAPATPPEPMTPVAYRMSGDVFDRAAALYRTYRLDLVQGLVSFFLFVLIISSIVFHEILPNWRLWVGILGFIWIVDQTWRHVSASSKLRNILATGKTPEEEARMNVAPGGLSASSARESVNNTWDQVQRAVLTPAGILVFAQWTPPFGNTSTPTIRNGMKMRVYWLPVEGFRSLDEFVAVGRWVETGVPTGKIRRLSTPIPGWRPVLAFWALMFVWFMISMSFVLLWLVASDR